MKKKIGAVLLAVALGGGASQAGAQCGKDLIHDVNADCVALGYAVKGLDTQPGYANSAAFKALSPDTQRAALARATVDFQGAVRKAEVKEGAVFAVVAVALLLWSLLAALHAAGLVHDALLLFRSLRRRRVEPAPGGWVAKGPGDSVVDVVVERPATALLGRGEKEEW